MTDAARYDRQIPLFGEEGQRRLARSTALVVGAGGLGSAVSVYLAVAGVGRIVVVDGDVVEVSNLNRQILHWQEDLGRPKAASAADSLRGLNPELEVEEVPLFADGGNLPGLVAKADAVVDALDNFSSRHLLNGAALAAGIPLFHGAISGLDGQATTIVPGATPCLRCIFPRPPPEEKVPALGATCGIVGSIQATEVVKHLTGLGASLAGRLLLWDGFRGRCDEIPLERNPGCPDCGRRREL